MQNQIKDEIQAAANLLFGRHLKTDNIGLEKPAEKSHGNLSTNISFSLARDLKKNPAEIATLLATELTKTGSFERVEAAGGFVNFFLKKDKYLSDLSEILRLAGKYGSSNQLKNQKVQVEFISANPTGPLTLGNSRGGFPGDVLANVFAKAGAKVTREYYFNNGGNQIKTLGESILVAAGLMEAKEDIYKGEYIDEWVKEHKKEIENLKSDPLKLGQLASDTVINRYIKPTIKKMGINYDVWFNEVDLVKKGEVEKTINRLKEKNLVYEKDGALWFKSSEFGDDKDRVMVKSDGLYTYFAVDAAYHWNKFAVRKFDKVVNIWGADHHGDVPRVMGVVNAMGFAGKLSILITQMVRLIKNGKEFKMSKRKGTYVTMDDLLELIGGPTKEASDVARFFFLSRSFNTHMDFDLDLAKERSEKNPVFYVKYAYARISGILRNAEKLKLPRGDLSLLADNAELDLIEQLSQLPSVVNFIVSSTDFPVHNLTFYILEIAKKFHYFYDQCRVIDEKNLELTAARLELVRATQIVLGIVGRDLIGVDMPEKM